MARQASRTRRLNYTLTFARRMIADPTMRNLNLGAEPSTVPRSDDLYEGFLRHHRDTRPDWDGRPIRRRPPTAADLLMHAKVAKQEGRDRRGGWPFCGSPECEGGFVRVEGPGDPVRMMRCPRCAVLRAEGAQRRTE